LILHTPFTNEYPDKQLQLVPFHVEFGGHIAHAPLITKYPGLHWQALPFQTEF